jgi:hypothetical protein
MKTLTFVRACRIALLAALPLLAVNVRASTYTVATSTDFNNALNQVLPGDVIVVSGPLTGNFKILRSGTASAPISIRGDGTAQLNSSSGYGFEIRSANYINLDNLIIRGGLKGLVIDNSNHGVVHRVHVMDTQQEAFKVRNQSQYWEFTYCSVRRAGTSGDFGEGFYVGQASSNWLNGVPDRSGFVTFFNCYTTDTVNDGWDFKEGSHDIKVVNCTADYSGTIEPQENATHGSSGFYVRADRIQLIKCSVLNLNNNDWSFRIANQAVGGVDYGSTGNEIKQSASLGGNVGMVYLESGTNGVIYTDYTVTSTGGLYAQNSATAILRDPAVFAERTWSGEGGGIWSDLSTTVGSDGDPLGAPSSQVSAPVFSPPGGAYASAQSVTITTATSGASIRYTVDGTTPSSTTGTLYSGPVNIASSTTLKAIAFKSGLSNSSVTSATYTINAAAQAAAPAFNPPGGTYSAAQQVTISSATSGASIRYTTDGSTPTPTVGTLYMGPLTIATTTILKAIAYASGMTNSTVSTATYTIATYTIASGGPVAPTSLAATGGKGKISLSWVQSTNAVARNRVYRATTSGGPYTLRSDFGARTTYNDTVAAGTTYYYVVTAVTSSGVESGYSNEASASAR